jgi:hypothetical protein
MADKTPDRITVLEGLEAVRWRPALYIGGEMGVCGQRMLISAMISRVRRHVSLLFSTWIEPMSQVRSTATAAFVTRPRATVLPLI